MSKSRCKNKDIILGPRMETLVRKRAGPWQPIKPTMDWLLPRPLTNQPWKHWAWLNIGHSIRGPRCGLTRCAALALPLCAGVGDCFSHRKRYRRTFYLNIILPDWETILDRRCSLMNKCAKANV